MGKIRKLLMVRHKGILLVIHGTLHSDVALWETTTMVNGYFLVVRSLPFCLIPLNSLF